MSLKLTNHLDIIKLKQVHLREKTHWCSDNKHEKCGGQVNQKIESRYTPIDLKKYLKKDHYLHGICQCYCHKNN